MGANLRFGNFQDVKELCPSECLIGSPLTRPLENPEEKWVTDTCIDQPRGGVVGKAGFSKNFCKDMFNFRSIPNPALNFFVND